MVLRLDQDKHEPTRFALLFSKTGLNNIYETPKKKRQLMFVTTHLLAAFLHLFYQSSNNVLKIISVIEQIEVSIQGLIVRSRSNFDQIGST